MLGAAGWAFGRYVLVSGRRRVLSLQLHDAAARQLKVCAPSREIEVSPDWAELVALQWWWQRAAWRQAFTEYRSACAVRQADRGTGQLYYANAPAVQAALTRLQALAGVKRL